MAHNGAAYASDVFTIIACPTPEQLLVHEAILGQSPVFRARTQLPFIEKQERTIRLPDDQASHLRCLVAFLYTSDFTTESEPNYEPRDQESGDDGSRREFKESEEAEAEAETGGYGRHAITRDGSSLPACIAVETRDSKKRKLDDVEFLTGDEAVAQELAQTYVLGVKYQLPELKRRTLEKLDDLVSFQGYPLQFLNFLTIFIGSVPDPDDDSWFFVQRGLQEAATVAEQRETKGEMVDSMIECGYLRQGGMLAEMILKAFAPCSRKHYDGW